MPSPYSSPEISQTGDPMMGQAGVQNPNVNENLYAASYPGAPGRAADPSMAGGGSDLASQGLAKLQQGDQYGGIMTLLDAAQQNPQSVNNQAFLQQLQIVENQPAGATAAPSDASQFTAPTDSAAYSTTSDASAASGQPSTAQASDASSVAMQALQVAQQNPTEGILGLMQASTQNPDLLNNQSFLTTMSQVLPQSAAGLQTGGDASQMQPQAQPTDASQMQPQAQPTDASQMQPQAQPTEASQMQPQAQPTDASQMQPQAQPTDASQMQPQAQPTDASQMQPQVQPTDASQMQPQVQPTDASQQPAAAQAYTMPAQLTSSGDPNIEAGVKQAFQMIQAGDQFDGARILMMIAKADPSILQDQAFIQNLTNLETAVHNGTASASSDQSASASQTGTDASQSAAQSYQLDANGNPIAPQMMTDANGNPIAQPAAQQMVDANGNPIAQPAAQQMVDAGGNPVATDAQGMPLTQSNPQMTGTTGMTAPSDSSQVASNSDPSVGAPAY